ncbi:MAG: VanZ family protein [Johnsonella sp.]|nr:VanZ family protein [Johnsonella sp.]
MAARRNPIQPKKKIVGWIFFIAYLFVLVYFLFFAEAFGRSAHISCERGYNLIPFLEIRRFWKYRKMLGFWSFLINITGNIIAFMPFGFFYPIIGKYKRRFLKTVAAGMIFSFSVEAIQFIINVGSFDIDDIMLNTAGCMIGYLLLVLSKHTLWKFEKSI